MVKKTVSLLVLVCLFLTVKNVTFSAETSVREDFSANFDVNYLVGEDGKTIVNQQITLTNLTANFYAKEYNLLVGSTKIDDIKASDSLGKINAEVTKSEKTTSIKLTFNDKVVGKDKSLKFNLSYIVSDVASKNGLMWDITLPKLQISADIKTYNLHLTVPNDFGEIHYISPNPTSVKKGNDRVFSFSREQLEKSGVSAAFGDFQLFDFELKYHLLNPNIFSATAQISLPPDTNSQSVVYNSLEPKPDRTETDFDGNYLAIYNLKSRQRLDVVAKGTIKLVESHRDLQRLPIDKSNFKDYLTGNQYWNLDPSIKEKAQQLTHDLKEGTSDEKARAIYDYVSTALKYDYERLKLGKIDRLGALGAINNPNQAICMEYTDLFIAMARSIGIPAREVNGYAFTQNKDLRPTAIGGKITSDVLHAWPEYYSDEKDRWFQIDPTWGSTTGGVDYFDKLDTNHIVFVIKGLSSDEPLPAGAYKVDANSSGDVTIKPTTIIPDEKPVIDVSFKDTTLPAGFSGNATLLVKNTGKRALFGGSITIDKNSTAFITPTLLNFGTVLPGSTVPLEFKIRSSSLFSSSDISFKAELTGSDGNNKITSALNQKISLRPFFTLGFIPFFFGGLILLILLTTFFLLRNEIRNFRKKA